ncbi:acyltransferase [Enterococcus dongliensis]|uniref:acyltransferase n=1 Tax=Enterococcus dongliensis TaxID=2559925 RepID=UPI0028913084|nr:acyltransferase [Enterococcus dongliensis]MDT2712392.1 acyltransferase [Enterococcus dongliensis]
MKASEIITVIVKRFVTSKNVKLDLKSRICFSTVIKTERKAYVFIKKGFHAKRNTTLHAIGGTIEIGENVFLNENVKIVAHSKISIGSNVTIGPNVVIYDHDHDVKGKNGFVTSPIVIADNVWIGANAIILKGVSIGRGAVVAAGTIVTKDVPENHIVKQKLSLDMMESIYKGDSNDC